MYIRLIDRNWDQELQSGLARSDGAWRLACPFIKAPVLTQLLDHAPLHTIQVVTRFNLRDFASGVSDIAALRAILDAGGEVRGLGGLHSKVFVFGSKRAAVTSANLTHAALTRNAEFGCISDDAGFVAACSDYLDRLWERASPTVTPEQLDDWQRLVEDRLVRGGQPAELSGLPDFGAAGPEPVPPQPPPTQAERLASPGWPAESEHGFVKFFGEGHNRAALDEAVLDEIRSSGCHWACTYPKSARPRTVRDGDTMFMGRMTHSPNDTMIFGRAIGLAHVDRRDTADSADIAQREWKADWPHYIRVHHAEFIAGRLANGISLNTLMDELGPHSFGSTQEHLLAQDGKNTNPRKALMQQPAARLTTEAFDWLTTRFEQSLATHGRVPTAALQELDWPEVALT